MNLHALVEFCKNHGIILNYNYDPRFGGGHSFQFMAEHDCGWIKFTRRIFDDDLGNIGGDKYCKLLIRELETELLPKLLEGKSNGTSENH